MSASAFTPRQGVPPRATGGGDLRIEWITDEETFASIREPWERLAEGQETPFATHAWYAAWWRAFGDGLEMRVCACWDGEDLAAALPLVSRGRGLVSMANVHTPVFDPPARDAVALEAVVAAAVARRPSEVEVEALPAGGGVLGALQGASRREGRIVFVEAQHESPVVETSGGFEEYARDTKSRWSAIARKRRKLLREREAEFVLLEAPDNSSEEIERGFALEASGWKASSGTAIDSDPRTALFYRSVATGFVALGGLRLSRLEVDGRLAAFDLCLEHRGRLYLLKTAYDESLGVYAPGLVMRLSVVERCFELGLLAHDLGGEATEWKRRFATATREHRVVRSYQRRPGPVLRYSYRRAARPLIKRAYLRARALREGDA